VPPEGPLTRAIRLVSLALLAFWAATDGARAGQARGAATTMTLREAIEQIGATTEGLAAASLARPITSYATLAEGGDFGIAYYGDAGDGLLHEPLYVGYKAQGQPWLERQARTRDRERGPFGSAVRISRAGSYLLVDCHRSPSAGNLLVFTRRLDLVSELYGFSLELRGFSIGSLPDGLILFVRSMIHFAPAHPGQLALYDAAAGRERQLYPTDEATPARRAFIKRLEPIYKKWAKVQPGYVYGYDPTWFDVWYEAASYDADTDTLRVSATFSADRHPTSIAPPQRLDLTVVCRQMKSAARRCEEVPRR
jgi:hypothetical protein